ncbi:hypothetical protein BOBR111200_25145 [Bordetella bronchialis]
MGPGLRDAAHRAFGPRVVQLEHDVVGAAGARGVGGLVVDHVEQRMGRAADIGLGQLEQGAFVAARRLRRIRPGTQRRPVAADQGARLLAPQREPACRVADGIGGIGSGRQRDIAQMDDGPPHLHGGRTRTLHLHEAARDPQHGVAIAAFAGIRVHPARRPADGEQAKAVRAIAVQPHVRTRQPGVAARQDAGAGMAVQDGPQAVEAGLDVARRIERGIARAVAEDPYHGLAAGPRCCGGVPRWRRAPHMDAAGRAGGVQAMGSRAVQRDRATGHMQVALVRPDPAGQVVAGVVEIRDTVGSLAAGGNAGAGDGQARCPAEIQAMGAVAGRIDGRARKIRLAVAQRLHAVPAIALGAHRPAYPGLAIGVAVGGFYRAVGPAVVGGVALGAHVAVRLQQQSQRRGAARDAAFPRRGFTGLPAAAGRRARRAAGGVRAACAGLAGPCVAMSMRIQAGHDGELLRYLRYVGHGRAGRRACEDIRPRSSWWRTTAAGGGNDRRYVRAVRFVFRPRYQRYWKPAVTMRDCSKRRPLA